MWVLVLSRFVAEYPRLQRELEAIDCFGLITGSAIRAQAFLQNRVPAGVVPVVIVVSDCDADLDHWTHLIRAVLRPIQILPIALRSNDSIATLGKKGSG
jgi:hypothetical protein